MFMLIENYKNIFRVMGNDLGTNQHLCNRTKNKDYESHCIHSQDSKKERK